MKPKREEDSLYDRDIETMKVQLDMANRNVSDVANYVQMLDGRMDSLTEKVDALGKRIPEDIATNTNLEEIVRLRSELAMDKIEVISDCAAALKDSHPKHSGWAVVHYAIIVILLLTTGWMGLVVHGALPERVARKIMTSGADDYWDLHQAALKVLEIGDRHRKEAKQYLRIIQVPENWHTLQMINRIQSARSIIIDGLWLISEDSTVYYVVHYLDASEIPRAILIKNESEKEITAINTAPISRKRLKKAKTKGLRGILDTVDPITIFMQGTWQNI